VKVEGEIPWGGLIFNIINPVKISFVIARKCGIVGNK
jgi:hypothetical protein